MKSKIILISLFLLIPYLYAYSQEEKETPDKSDKSEYDDAVFLSFEIDTIEWKKKILEEGDRESYRRLSVYYLVLIEKNYSDLLLPYTLVMAEVYGSDNYYQVLVKCLLYEFDKNKVPNEKRIEKAIYYLRKGVEKKQSGCRLQLAQYYREGKYVEKNEEAAEYLYSGGYNLDEFLSRQKKRQNYGDSNSLDMYEYPTKEPNNMKGRLQDKE